MRIWPQTRIGWWGFVGAGLSVVLFGVNRLVFTMQTPTLSAYEVTTFLVGLVGSVCTLVALFWRRDDAWAVRLSLLPLVIFMGGLLSLVWLV
ncbi:MAG: hypothetical protein FJ040_07975 [Chloroflexi bacterium]|jgi:hypothetical protein|nr:hypothetical protein [Chloroflexota bacterium]